MLFPLENGQIYITKGTSIPFMWPKCNSIIPVESLDKQHKGADRDSLVQTCSNCNYIGDTEEFDVEFEFRPAN